VALVRPCSVVVSVLIRVEMPDSRTVVVCVVSSCCADFLRPIHSLDCGFDAMQFLLGAPVPGSPLFILQSLPLALFLRAV
jgi:hypothetical protein